MPYGRQVLWVVVVMWGLVLGIIGLASQVSSLDVLALERNLEGAASEIFLVDSRGRLVNMTRSTASESSPVWSPDGRQLVFVRQQPDATTLYRLDWDTLEVDKLIDVAHSDDPAWSPDGRYLAFTLIPSEGSRSEIFTRDMSTGELRNLTESGQRLVYSGTRPVWSPGGDKLLYINRMTRRVVVAALPYGEVLLQTPPNVESPVWSPDGSAIAYLSSQDRLTPNLIDTLVIQPIDRPEDVQRLTPEATEQLRVLAWSPGGRMMAFAGELPNVVSFRNRNGFTLPTERVFLMDTRTGAVTPAAEVTGFVWSGTLTWSPDGERLAFTLETPNATQLCFVRVATGGHRCYAGVIASAIDWQPQP